MLIELPSFQTIVLYAMGFLAGLKLWDIIVWSVKRGMALRKRCDPTDTGFRVGAIKLYSKGARIWWQ